MPEYDPAVIHGRSFALARHALRGDMLAQDALSSDPVLGALKDTITSEWVGTAADLLAAITPGDKDWRAPRDWPRTALVMRGVLKRRSPSLRRLGWVVDKADDDPHSKVQRTRLIPPGERQPENDPRNTRNTRSGDISPAQGADDGAGVAGVCGGSGGDTRNPENTRRDTRTTTPPVTSENTVTAGVAGVAGIDSALSLLTPVEENALRLVTETFGDVTLLGHTDAAPVTHELPSEVWPALARGYDH